MSNEVIQLNRGVARVPFHHRKRHWLRLDSSGLLVDPDAVSADAFDGFTHRGALREATIARTVRIVLDRADCGPHFNRGVVVGVIVERPAGVAAYPDARLVFTNRAGDFITAPIDRPARVGSVAIVPRGVLLVDGAVKAVQLELQAINPRRHVQVAA